MTEIAQLTFEDLEEQERLVNKEKICMYFCLFIQKIVEVTKGRSLLDEFNSVVNSKNQSGFENFAKQLALSISAVLKSNIDLIEHTTNSMEQNQNILFLQQCVQQSLTFLTQLSRIPEDELFKICLEFWHFFAYNTMLKTKGN